MNKSIAVLIPSYAESLTSNEMISLIQVRKILREYDIFFILPTSLKIDYSCEDIIEKRYPNEYFSSRRAYSRFMLEPILYKDFIEYDYILVYQLDAFVFWNRLKYFYDLGYDYIGAPWIDGIYFKKNRREYKWHVGNGGLSLRRTSAFLKWIEHEEFFPYIDFINEDILIAVYGYPYLNIAPLDIAASFSFEMDYEQCIKLTEGKMPFGCHGWEKYDFDFWKPLIEKQGYKVETAEKNEIENANAVKVLNKFCCRKYTYDEIRKMIPLSYQNRMQGVYIWGVGFWGISLMQKLLDSEVFVSGFVDNDSRQFGKKILSYPIIQPEFFYNTKKPIIIAIEKKSEEVEKQLQKYGYKRKRDYIVLGDIIKEILNER
ncbi:MAG: hypothetical protein HFG54_04575 [Lachnospiraceae bacterium]|nr:hypothetical protein [Lachnospiraceae bacterium]